MAEKPMDLIHSSLEKKVLVEIRGNRVFRGILLGYDLHLNFVLANSEELANDEVIRSWGTVILRGATVIYISPIVS